MTNDGEDGAQSVHSYKLGQALIVAPEVPFQRIDAALLDIGWQRNERIAPTTAPLVPGEPEIAGWMWHGRGKPLVTYTFNPVVRLRVLDVATVPPPIRGVIAEHLPLVGPEAVAPLLGAADLRDRLRGLWITGETERLDLAAAVKRLSADREKIVAKVAGEVAERLDRLQAARAQTLEQLRLLAETAAPLIRRLGDPATVAGLCPTAAECARLFDAAVAGPLAEQLAALWPSLPPVNPGDRHTELTITAAPAGLLRAPSELSHKFPLGYRNIAGWMEPSRVWLTWTLSQPGGTGTIRYDGLAWAESRWVWLPKVFRLVAPLVLAG